jgi:hypothetical protein
MTGPDWGCILPHGIDRVEQPRFDGIALRLGEMNRFRMTHENTMKIQAYMPFGYGQMVG